MRKNFSVFFIVLAFLLSCSVFFSYTLISKAFAEEIDSSTEKIAISSKSGILLDADSGTVLSAHNENAAYPIASMCKIMTLLLSFESIDDGIISFDEKITVSDTAAGMGGSQVFLEANAEYSVEDLLKSITVASANDACVAIAERISGSEDLFVEKMNEKAKKLDMVNTIFENCTGLPKPGQHSTAKDVSKMFSELLKHKDYFRFSGIWMDEIHHPNDRKTEISNTNKLIKFYKGCDSGKTGYTAEAGHCLCASAIRDGLRLISVVISAPDSKTRFKEVSSMFNYGFSHYENKTIIKANEPLNFSAELKGGKKSTVSIASDKTVKVLSEKNRKTNVEIDFIPEKNLKAPMFAGQRVGVINIYENGIKIDGVIAVATENIDKKSFFDVVSDIATKWSLIS